MCIQSSLIGFLRKCSKQNRWSSFGRHILGLSPLKENSIWYNWFLVTLDKSVFHRWCPRCLRSKPIPIEVSAFPGRTCRYQSPSNRRPVSLVSEIFEQTITQAVHIPIHRAMCNYVICNINKETLSSSINIFHFKKL